MGALSLAEQGELRIQQTGVGGLSRSRMASQRAWPAPKTGGKRASNSSFTAENPAPFFQNGASSSVHKRNKPWFRATTCSRSHKAGRNSSVKAKSAKLSEWILPSLARHLQADGRDHFAPRVLPPLGNSVNCFSNSAAGKSRLATVPPIAADHPPSPAGDLNSSCRAHPRGSIAVGIRAQDLDEIADLVRSAMALATLGSVVWPSQSTKKKYSHALRLLGRDSILVMFNL